ncbi:VirB8/TrbF family protein [Saccharopolyspora gloriosae]|uniref:VirB8/TrbF family protein n=1 Tax=Saccharopolyspora gloriosae TaxID=455344 RepID=UPI001FB59E9C|nr:VirB8/TrbF family protein [Saccharopolyspora gloriosae]
MTSDRAESDRDAGTTRTRLPEADAPGTAGTSAPGEGAEAAPAGPEAADLADQGGGTIEPESTVDEDEAESRVEIGESATGAPGRTRLGALRRPPVLIAALVILLLLGGLGYTGLQLQAGAARDSARQEALVAGKQYALALTTYDHQNLQDNFGSVSDNASPAFARQYQEVSDGLTQLIQQYQATSKGEVLNAGVVQAEQDRAVLVLFVDQTITNTNSPQPRVDRTRMQLTLVHPDDKWLIDDVKLI